MPCLADLPMRDPRECVSRETTGLDLVGARLERGGRVGPLDLHFRLGEWVGMLGPNGAGKSSLLRMTVGAARPDIGTCRWNGHDPRALRGEARRSAIAYLPQRTPDAGAYTAREQVSLGAASPRAGERALEVVGISGLADRPLSTLSGGERRRAALAAVLAQESACLVLDEPFSGLDNGIGERIAEALRDRADAGALVLVALHDPDLALRHATRVLLLEDGRVLGDRSPDDPILADALRALLGLSRMDD